MRNTQANKIRRTKINSTEGESTLNINVAVKYSDTCTVGVLNIVMTERICYLSKALESC